MLEATSLYRKGNKVVDDLAKFGSNLDVFEFWYPFYVFSSFENYCLMTIPKTNQVMY